MTNQHGLFLTKEVDGMTLCLTNVSDNNYRLVAEDGTFKVGKGASYSDGSAINQPKVNEHSVMISKAEMKRLGTYKLYLNGKDIKAELFSTWKDSEGRELIFTDESDIYYYFRRPDCGIVQRYRADGSHYATDFHYAIGRTEGSKYGRKESITVLSK